MLSGEALPGACFPALPFLAPPLTADFLFNTLPSSNKSTVEGGIDGDLGLGLT